MILACYLLLIMVVVRCADGRMGVNGWAGIRTPTILTNEQTWLAGHKAAKKASLVGIFGAIASVLAAIFVPNGELQSMMLIASCIILLAGLIVGTYKGTKAAKLVLLTHNTAE